jgi:hypothetical protein
MKQRTIRSLLLTCVVLDLALLGVVLYDYYQNDSDWIVWVLTAFALFVLITAILFALAGRGERTGERVVEKVVVKEVERAEARQDPIPQPWRPTGERVTERTVVVRDYPPIPPAPIRALMENPPRRIPAPTRPVASGVPFTFNGYTLHTRDVVLNSGGGKRTIYFFSKRKPKSGKMCAKPLGYHVGVNERTGLPFLKKGAGPDGEDLTPAAREEAYRPQCSAITEAGEQCRNSARENSKYCGSHFGYQPPVLARSAVDDKDTEARVKDAPDTKPSTRKNWFGRRRQAST